jgi:TRAP-type mannitol/chloroaromatic compound transport system permease large subunit
MMGMNLSLCRGTRKPSSTCDCIARPPGRRVSLRFSASTIPVGLCLLDPIGIMIITAPLFFPIATGFGFDPVWFGILFVVNMEMAFLTPPVGFNLFYIKGVAPEGVTMHDIYRSVTPFVLLQATALSIIMILPDSVLWLPKLLLR